MVYLRTIVSADNEIKYIKLQLEESRDYVDNIIVCEFDRTHTGEEREFVFQKYMEDGTFSDEEKKRIIYIKGKVGNKVLRSQNDSNIMHKNEKLFRGYFARHVRLKPDDIIISVDADEIIFRRKYEKILSFFINKKDNPIVQLRLYQFFYKPTYLWENKIFAAPTVCRVKVNRFKYPAQWRYEGEILDDIVGCHFSWLLTVDEMISKLNNYAHSADYGHLAQKDILEKAVKDKEYPFNPSIDFQIREINYIDNPEYYPDTFMDFSKQFEYLIHE